MKRTELHSELHWLALILSPHIGAKTLNSLLRHFDQDVEAIFAAPAAELLKVRGIGRAIAREIRSIDLERVAADLERWRHEGMHILSARDGAYPERLRNVADAPPALFASGQAWADNLGKTMAIVGTRNPSKEARFITLQLAMKLAQTDYTVVSGLALGIDTAAHTGALSATGKTIAVLGSGLLKVYPEQNRPLAERIRAEGCLMSELHPDWGANAQRLVSRNRIISGLSQAVIVVESNVDGGAMYAARFAREQERPVYTFDLPASGNQALIKRGAFVLKRENPLDSLLRS